MNTPEARKLIGELVEWDVDSLYYPVRYGIVEDVKSRNIWIDGECYWLPKLKNLRRATKVPKNNP